MKRINIVTIAIVACVWVIGIVAVSCNERRGAKAPESKRMELDTNSRYYDQQYKVYTLEGCEYLVVGSGDLRWGSHKGNCKNPIHQESTDLDFSEKHFDCTVEDCVEEGNEYQVTTECGIVFYSRKPYERGEILKEFVSPKHK